MTVYVQLGSENHSVGTRISPRGLLIGKVGDLSLRWTGVRPVIVAMER